MKRLAIFLRGYVKESILGPLLKLAEATLELIVPLVIAAIVDRGIANSDKGYVVRMSLVLVALGIVGLIFSVTAQYFCAKASVGFATKLRLALFKKMQTLSYTDIDRLGTSTMITRMTADSSRVQSGLNLALRLLLRSPFVVFGAAIMAFTIDVRSAMTFVFAIPLLSIIIFGIMRITSPMYKKVQKGTDVILEKTRENLFGVRVIRAFCEEDNEIESFKRENAALMQRQMRVGGISALLNPLTYVVINLAILWLVQIGAVRVSMGALSAGAVLALYNYMSQILIELIKLANLIVSITKALASASRIKEALDMPTTASAGKITEKANTDIAVEFSSVELTYRGAGAPALSGLSFSARRGETIGIIGGTGSGKSSLVNLIPGFYPVSAGEVRVFGHEVSEYDPEALLSFVGVVPQRAVLFSGSIRDNMRSIKRNATDEEITEALRAAQILDTVNDMGGLDAKIEQGGANLSGGQRQRLTVARALVAKPDILILDDSASALDFATDAAMRRDIKNITEGSTLFIVSQRAFSVMHADKIIVVDDGRAVGIGTHDELLESCEVYREIYESQFA